ncbi:uncharacterized protein LOC126326554 [Schistocerca gregaria]|uniref:uncharacterized protein LOC126326554 n=1 Tax=Schistocerca gregaria TaxID=7010 RepID=UPI00211E0A96|nr:uncharacterized protein LOC126326554 [Schistocerca gregaria]
MRLQSGAWEEKCWKFFSLDARSVLGYYSLSCSLQQGGHLFLDVDDLAKQVSQSLTRLEAISKEMERAMERELRLDERIEELNRTLHLLRPKGHFGCRVSLQFDEHQVRWEDRWVLTMWVTTSTESCLSKNWMLVVRVIQGGVNRVYSSSVSPFGSTESSDMAEGKGWMFRWVVYLQSHEPVEVACYLVYHVSEWYPNVSEGDSLNLNEPSGGFDGHVAYLYLGTQEFDLLDWIVCAKKGTSLGALQNGTCTLLPFRQQLCAILSEGVLDAANSGPPGDEYVGSDIRIGTPLVTDGSNLDADLSRIFGRRLDAWTKSNDSACNNASSNGSATDTRSFFLTSGFLQPLSIKIRQETLKLSVSSEELTTSISGRLRVSDVIDIPILALSMFSPRQVSSLLRAAVLQRIAQSYELGDQQLDFPALRLNPPAILSRQYFGEGIQALNATLEGVRVDMLGIGDRLDALFQIQSNPTHPSMVDISRISLELQDQIRAAYRTTRAHISDNLIW